jgi:hypothetical protein
MHFANVQQNQVNFAKHWQKRFDGGGAGLVRFAMDARARKEEDAPIGETGAPMTFQQLVSIFPAVLLAAAAHGAAVSADVARTVAEEQVASFFPGEAWTVSDCVQAVDGDGAPAAWAVVFALSDGAYAADGAVRAAVQAGETGDDGESTLYAETATVVTGANDTDSLVFRTFRGLADWYQAFAASGGAGELVRLGAGDIRFEAPSAATRGGKGRVSSLRKAAKARAAARAAEKEALPDELKALSGEAEAEAAAAAKARWGAAAETQKTTARAAALKAAGLAE